MIETLPDGTTISEADDVVKPQEGPQEAAFQCTADIMFYGGSAGAGKTFYILAQPLAHVHNPGFACTIFRRTTKQIKNEGGLWDEAREFYPKHGGYCVDSALSVEWENGSRIQFRHMEHEKDRLAFDGAQIGLIEFDELQRFTKKQFLYMISRNRTRTGNPKHPYIRASLNPMPGHWLWEWVSWFIDPETGWPIEERSGVLRYFYMVGDTIHWYASEDEAREAHPNKKSRPKSFTFIPGKLEDNKILMQRDPDYAGNIDSMGHSESLRLSGNWFASDDDDKEWPEAVFQDIWVDEWPGGKMIACSALDPASGKRTDKHDFPAFILLGTRDFKTFYVDAIMEKLNFARLRPMVIDWIPRARRPEPAMLTIEVDNKVYLDSPYDFSNFEIATAFDTEMADAGLRTRVMIHTPPTGISKAFRIRRLDELITNRRLKFIRNKYTEEVVHQLRHFPLRGFHDDGPDCLDSAFQLMKTIGKKL